MNTTEYSSTTITMSCVGVHKKRSLPQTLDYDIENDQSNDNVSNGGTNASSYKRLSKSHALEQNTILDYKPTNGPAYIQNDNDHSLACHQRTKPSLLCEVLSKRCRRVLNPSPSALSEFEFPEEQITFDDIIGTGEHSIVFRITASGRTFALKVVGIVLPLFYRFRY